MGAYRTCIIFITIQLVSMATAQDLGKRVPQGFLGMRGKKFFGKGVDSTELFYKQRPQYLVGFQGKPSLQDILESGDEYYKRSPMGFIGMRGKKEAMFSDSESSEYVPKRDGSLIGQIEYASGDNPEFKDPFPIINELLVQYLKNLPAPNGKVEDLESQTESELLQNEIVKRAANKPEFYGVRGKKSLYNKRPYDSVSFRGKFIGVRGKKDVKNADPHEIRFLLNGPLPKRKSQMGFFGMRGKKSDAGVDSNQYNGLGSEEYSKFDYLKNKILH